MDTTCRTDCVPDLSIHVNVHTCIYTSSTYVLVSWLRGGSKENCAYLSHVAQDRDTAQVTRQVSLLGLIA